MLLFITQPSSSIVCDLLAVFVIFSAECFHNSGPTQYGGEADSLRGFCEIFTLIMVVFYICEEINQMRL